MLDRLLISSSARAIDPQFRNVTLLLHGDGSNGAQNNTFLDSSSNNFTVTRNGNTTQGSFNPYGSRWSNYFDNSGDSLSVPDNAAFNFGTGDFTVEAWVYLTQYNSADYQPVFSNAYLFYIGGAGQVLLFNGSSEVFTGMAAGDVPINAWTHIAWVRSGSGTNNTKVYVNGVQKGQATLTASVGSANPNRIGQYSTVYFPGYISDLRVVKAAVYTAAFTPPIAPLTAITNTSLLTCQSNRFRDASTNNFTITRNGDVRVTPFSPYAPSSAYSATANGGSIYLDGTGDYLNLASNSAFAAPGDFTFECWTYCTSSAAGQIIYLVNATNGLIIYTSSNKVVIRSFGVSNLVTSSINLPVNEWAHIAAVRSGTTLSLFINGSRANGGTATNSTSFAQGEARIGVNESGFDPFTGFISNLRFVKGTAVYDPTQTTITVPTAPVTAVTNTQLLLNGTNAAIFDSAADNNLETVGNAQISTSVKKFGTGSIYFDGSGDWIDIPNNPVNFLGSGDFTVEFWVYGNSWSTLPILLEYGRQGASNTPGLEFYVSTSGGKLDVYGGSTTGTLLASYSNMPTTTWTHVALTRASGSNRLFINGVQSGTATTDTANYNQAFIRIGAFVNGSNSLNGYIDDLRVTKGVARYTANFTPPAAPFPDQ